jgi:biopolymer transport protein ExbB
MMTHAKLCALLLAVSSSLVPLSGQATSTLDQLLTQVRRDRAEQAQRNADRERRFLAERDTQRKRLTEAHKELDLERTRGEELQQAFEANRNALAELEAGLRERTGELFEVFGNARQTAAQTAAVLRESLVTTQIPRRTLALTRLSESKSVPDIDDLETLWYTLQQEMTESGKVVTYSAPLVSADGKETVRRVTRVGLFNAVAEGRFLRYLPDTGKFEELPRQPPAHYLDVASAFEESTAGMVPMVLDPTRGAVLGLLVKVPGLLERIQQGKLVGYMIIGVALLGILIALERWMRLGLIAHRMRQQLSSRVPNDGNPLGRVMAVYQQNQAASTETLELLVDESILKETPRLQHGLHALKILAMIAPLLGLLGTVVGLIETFQSITLFGTGDPGLMAGGISQALVTTVLGLIAAIPLILTHSALLTKSRRLVEILEQQSIGIIARHAEELEAHAAAA